MDVNRTIQKIKNTRINLKKYLENEWETDIIAEYSDEEISILYKNNSPSNIKFGYASGCNFTLKHKSIPEHNLHVIYYNFPEIGKSSTKVTKTCADKLNNLYKESIIKEDDSIIVIMYNSIPENIEKSIESMYISGKEHIKSLELPENLATYLSDESNQYSYEHIRNIHIYHLDELSVDILSNSLVPTHRCIRDTKTINDVLTKNNCSLSQLPQIMRTDPVSKRFRIASGDIFEIERITQTGGVRMYYRVCR